MSNAARIDELRIKFEENPRRYFAPLANEYRKAGDLAQAIALCREHLPKQPGHMSGYIVFGQALYESGELEEAREVFEQALDLDPENLIALRHLGDIARAGGDASGARRWYERVLDADPRNDDIAAQLATLATTSSTPRSVQSVVPSYESLTRTPMTPPVPMTSIGFGATPTPDSVMRAVDMDVVNARMPQRTPIDLEAIESAGTAQESAAAALGAAEATAAPLEVAVSQEAAAPVESNASPDSVVTDTVESPVSEESPTAQADEPNTQDTAEKAFESAPDAFDFPAAPRSLHDSSMAAMDEHPDAHLDAHLDTHLDEGLVDVDEESFEEGLIAAAWPDTSELVARVLTPRAFTPRFVTPLDSAYVEDTVSAFGREPGDPKPFSLDQPDSVELPVEAANADSGDELIVASVHALQETTAEATAQTTAETTAEDAAVEPTAATEELPWLSVADSEMEAMEAGDDDEPGLQAIVEALADDARAAGDVGPIAVEAVEETSRAGEPDPFRETFADVARELVAESTSSEGKTDEDDLLERFAEVSISAETREADVPAFVTETMGELLVSQGFVGRAVDVYEELVRRRPYDPVLGSRLMELRALLAATTAPQSVNPVFAEDDARDDDLGMPALPTPGYGTPSLAMPYVTPRVTPYAQPAVAEELPPRRSAREWFAAIAARRVPRRTPPLSTPAVSPSSESLSALFGNDASMQDDAAAQALADAFAPVSAHELESGSALDFEFARSTPVFTPVVAVAGTPPRSPSMTPPLGTNAGFSFDRFFPDPAAVHRPTPATTSPVVPEAPVTDDLAQFSVWLKGLGNS